MNLKDIIGEEDTLNNDEPLHAAAMFHDVRIRSGSKPYTDK